MSKLFYYWMILALCSGTIGCGGGPVEKPTYAVIGKVTLDNAPVDGTINFESDPPDGLPPGSALIKNGEYSLKATAGKKLVKISAPQVVPGEKGPMDTEVTRETIPAIYNTESKEFIEVTTGKNTHNFDLKK